ncbi:MAG: tRNA 2-thiouridine(34) synthase MnmA [Myxococcaceae bacterium]|nr:tRNA 2-thiouridine(34) synthase MnmA [Myxococcaceae bacterium]MBH2005934.1 tRNA 2-thiouridine(34) synthase MnmA [Myxococcaceae bacterium]
MKIVVALSGGVDSSVAALLLKEQGHEVIGVSLRLAPDDHGSLEKREGRCCSIDDMTDARQICDRLQIPFYAIDSRERFKEIVFEPFVKAYRSGQTPIPCLACNHEVKFGDLYQTAKALGASLATGHYAKIVTYQGHKTLSRPLDRSRDQTYYLYGTDPEVIQHLHLPLADLPKPQVRALAQKMGLKVHDKPDSHEICFVPDGDHAKVVENASGPMPTGEMRRSDGQHIQNHSGIHHFTIGQRRGIGIGLGERSYVVDLDPTEQIVTLGPKSALACSKVSASPIKAIVPTADWPKEVWVQIRSRHEPQRAHWSIDPNGELVFEFFEPAHAIALGQAAVAYDGDVLLGGGILTGRLDGKFARKSILPTNPAKQSSSEIAPEAARSRLPTSSES